MYNHEKLKKGARAFLPLPKGSGFPRLEKFMNINRWKEKLVAAAAMVTLFPQTVFASAIQDAFEDADTASFDSVDAVWATAIDYAEAWIPPAATLALLIGVLCAFVCAPLKKYRGFGLGCIVFSIAMFLLYLLLPTIITMFATAG